MSMSYQEIQDAVKEIKSDPEFRKIGLQKLLQKKPDHFQFELLMEDLLSLDRSMTRREPDWDPLGRSQIEGKIIHPLLMSGMSGMMPMNFPLTLFRGLNFSKKEWAEIAEDPTVILETIDLNGAGVSWADNLDGVNFFLTAGGGSDNIKGVCVYLKGQVEENAIDWEKTLLVNIAWPDEYEVRLVKEAKLHLTDLAVSNSISNAPQWIPCSKTKLNSCEIQCESKG